VTDDLLTEVSRMRLTLKEKAKLEEIAGGPGRVSNFLRGLVNKYADENNIELEPSMFGQRGMGNRTKGVGRKGGKESGMIAINSHPAFA
jgi:hypothetical protein